MSISGISNNALYQPAGADGLQQPRKNDLQSLTAALQSGNLQQAQQAFSSLSQNSPVAATTQTGQVSQVFQAIGKALKAGDLAGAQKALATLQQAVTTGVQGHHPGGHHHHGAKTSTVNPSTTNTSTDQPDNSLGGTLEKIAVTAINLVA